MDGSVNIRPRLCEYLIGLFDLFKPGHVKTTRKYSHGCIIKFDRILINTTFYACYINTPTFKVAILWELLSIEREISKAYFAKLRENNTPYMCNGKNILFNLLFI